MKMYLRSRGLWGQVDGSVAPEVGLMEDLEALVLQMEGAGCRLTRKTFVQRCCGVSLRRSKDSCRRFA